MVNIIENWAKINGVVKSITTNPKLKNYYLVEVELITVLDFEDFPNLAKRDEGNRIFINVKMDEFKEKGIMINKEISEIVRKAYGQVYFIK